LLFFISADRKGVVFEHNHTVLLNINIYLNRLFKSMTKRHEKSGGVNLIKSF